MTLAHHTYRSPRQKGLRIPIKHFSFANIWCFVLPVLSCFKISLIGTLMLSDLAVLVLFLLLLHRRADLFRQPYLKEIQLMLGLWAVVAVISDLVAGSSLTDILRNIARMMFFSLYLAGFMALIDGLRSRYVLALAGLALSNLLTYVLGWGYVAGGFFDTPWKFGNGFSVSILLMIFLGRILPTNRLQGIFMLGFSFIHLVLNARSLFLSSFLSSASAAFSLAGQTRKARAVIAAFLLLFAGLMYPIAEYTYGKAVMSGAFGDKVRDKYIMQTASGLGVILGGRSEMLISLKAVADKPLLGHGSYAKDAELRLAYFRIRESLGEEIRWDSDFVSRSDLIPTHSFLFGAWVNHGIVGALFWAYIMMLIFRAIVAGMFGTRPASPIELLPLFLTLWSILFSPFGETQRLNVAISIAIASTILSQNNTRPMRPQNSEVQF